MVLIKNLKPILLGLFFIEIKHYLAKLNIKLSKIGPHKKDPLGISCLLLHGLLETAACLHAQSLKEATHNDSFIQLAL
ncbi:hypothetical protein ATS75_16780 [Pseudoalteromonas sp. H105]|nr:hypothetical protein ATS75_16780 [Pseudoalteromonas sp. H105]